MSHKNQDPGNHNKMTVPAGSVFAERMMRLAAARARVAQSVANVGVDKMTLMSETASQQPAETDPAAGRIATNDSVVNYAGAEG